MENDKELTEDLIKYSKKIGIDIIGFADPKYYDRFSKINRPERFLKDAKSVIIIGIHLYEIILDAWSQDQKTGKSFHYLDSILENRCYLIKEYLAKKGFNSEIVPYNQGLFLKDSAALAGIGPIGKNNLLITKEFGSQIRLRAMVTNAPLISGNPITESEYCVDCNICHDACPAKAFVNGKYVKDICFSYNLSHLKKISEYTSIWCNVCIESCPVSKKSIKSSLQGYFTEEF
ncbi:MAG: epoxyqueuosine reductase [Promethearchaeota archaeon]|nr:MAG: epoxyqueuosine reductase [Candidatus Lokiarchaeota archaeon]